MKTITMNNKNLHFTYQVDQSATEVFNAITNVSKWWTENLQGHSAALNDEFTVQFDDMHVSTQRLIEVIPNKKIVWLVTDSRLSWILQKDEWTGTKVVFEISNQGNKTQIEFTHIGLLPEVECYDGCADAWNQYVCASLFKLITTGKGQPEKKKLPA